MGNSGIVVPPPKNPQKNPKILFDSLVNSTTTPTIFVMIPDAQSYPEYLITFTLVNICHYKPEVGQGHRGHSLSNTLVLGLMVCTEMPVHHLAPVLLQIRLYNHF